MEYVAHKLTLPWEIPKGISLQVVGSSPIMLYNDYDPRQLWLPFSNLLIISKEKESYRVARLNRYEIQCIADRRFATIPDKYRVLFRPEKGVPQLLLPFEGMRRIGHGNYLRLKETEFPGWERSPSGHILTFKFNQKQRGQFKEYCDSNCRGRYHFNKNSYVAFELTSDYIMAKVAFSIGD